MPLLRLTITFDPKDYPTPRDLAPDAENVVWFLPFNLGDDWNTVDRSGMFFGMYGPLNYTIEETEESS